MMENSCAFDVEKYGERIKVKLHGEIDHHNAVAVRGELDELIYRERPTLLEIELSEIGFMDSSGLGLIMGRYALVKKLGGELVLKNPGERILKIFELAGLGRIVKISNDKREDENDNSN